MFTTDLYLDRVVPDAVLAQAFADAFGVRADRVAVVPEDDLDAIARAWEREDVVIRTSRMRGEFPQVVGLMTRGLASEAVQPMLERVARSLRAVILTDEVGVNPFADSEWLLIGPDGTATPVIADAEAFNADDPAIVLVGDSRRVLREVRFGASLAG